MRLKKLKKKILDKGGFINSHSHIDRFNTCNLFTEEEETMFLHEKWKLVDRVKQSSDFSSYYRRLAQALASQKEFGVSTILSFIDLDNIVQGKAINAAAAIRDDTYDIKLMTACQTLKGVLDKENQKLIESNLHLLNIIGSLPAADAGREAEHLDYLMSLAKANNKMLHVHVDQLNCKEEKELELLARKTIEHGIEGKVVAVHSLSIAAHKKKYRNNVYKICKDAGMMFICCPSAWIDHPRKEQKQPSHNSITPIDELQNNDLIVALGTDNIYDIYKPYCDGDPMFELRLILESFKIYNDEELIKIAIDNGKKVLGIQ